MAPTEILAEQHARNFNRWLEKSDYKVEMLIGSMKAKEKRDIHEALKSGEIDIIVGTHALIQEAVEFKKIYNLEVTSIPTNRIATRSDEPDVVYKNTGRKRITFINRPLC